MNFSVQIVVLLLIITMKMIEMNGKQMKNDKINNLHPIENQVKKKKKI
jgi:hypothetical protein